MHTRVFRYFLLLQIAAFLFLASRAEAGIPQAPGVPLDPSTLIQGSDIGNLSANAEIYVKDSDGKPIERPAVVMIFRMGGMPYRQDTTTGGFVKFTHMPHSEFTVQVVAPGYQSASKTFEIKENGAVTITLNLQPMEAEDAATSVGFYALAPKVQKDVAKALEALRANKPAGALPRLEAAQRNAPQNAEIEYLFGVYASQINDDAQAKAHWTKALQLDSRHLNALLSLGQDLVQQKKAADAMPYLTRAVDVAPTSWRAHSLLAQADVTQGQQEEAVKHAERAIELGHDRAASAQLVLIRVRIEKNEIEKAIPMLVDYVKAHPEDKTTAEYLENLKNPPAATAGNGAASKDLNVSANGAEALPVPTNWLPPDVDASVPAVEPGSACALDDVVAKAGKQLLVLVADVDRFAATESLTHETINRLGLSSAPEKRKFDYVASIREVKPGYLISEEYRLADGSPAVFPDGVATNGLPAMVLIFHPYNAPNFEMTCEGLARWNGGLAWQIHFKQRPDKPNTIKSYRIGADGPSYPVALKGRAWISADTFQIVRMETDLVSPVPQIRLFADHTMIEYGPVKFAKGNVSMWLPQSAEVYYDWRGRRTHRRHSFSKYMLFAVDDKQKISAPKVDQGSAGASSSGDAPKEKP